MHFTYESPNRGELHQGDVLRRTAGFEAILREVHPHYSKKKPYAFFSVLTQTCDLVRRNGEPCKSPYITIAAARPARDIVEKLSRSCQFDDAEKKFKFASKKQKTKLDQHVERLLNNNHPDYFFLKQESNLGLDRDYCVILKLSIALRAEHYATLLEAKTLQLTESFQHKLGHHVGMLYSRIATEDWVPDHCLPEKFQEQISQYTEDENLILWLDPEEHKLVLKKLRGVDLASFSEDEFNEVVKSVAIDKVKRRSEHLDLICSKLELLGLCEVQLQNLEKFRTNLDNDSAFRFHLK